MSTTTAHPKATIDPRRYGRLLSRAQPRAIRNDKELEAMTAELLKLDELEEAGKASLEELELAELLTVLIERYEEEHYPIILDGPPHERLAAVMEHRGLSQSDIAKVLGSRSLASEILSGKREISKAAVKKLAESLRAPAELFI
jgi:HTH-type transcriptional regulator / antitoxin HigA